MHIDRHGTKSGPAVVLLHGVPGSPDSWAGVVPGLADDHDVLVPHLLGFGRSPSSGDLLAVTQATALRAALEARGVGPATFVAHDFGAPIALTLYADAPHLFGGIVILATNVFPDTHIPFPLNLVTVPVVGNAFARVLFSGPALELMVRRNHGSQVGNAASVRTIFRTSLQRLADLYAGLAATMQSIDVPMTIMWGTADPFFPIAHAHRTAALVPRADLVLVDGAGHFLPEEHPDRVVEAVKRLVSTVAPRPPRKGD